MTPTPTNLALASLTALSLSLAALVGAVPAHAKGAITPERRPAMHVAQSPSCGCCGAWVALARDAGFDARVTNTDDVTAMKITAGVRGALWSCHTAVIGGYVVAGHVPFAVLARLLEERPEITGIAVPGMPMGSPGMGTDPAARLYVIAFGGTAGEGAIFHRVGQ